MSQRSDRWATSQASSGVWSGDGTVACTFENAGPDGPPILPLPGGTMNLFHKQIHGGPCEWRECLERGLSRLDVVCSMIGVGCVAFWSCLRNGKRKAVNVSIRPTVYLLSYIPAENKISETA